MKYGSDLGILEHWTFDLRADFLKFQVSDRDEKVICYIVNTAEYCHETVCPTSFSRNSFVDFK